MTPRFRPGQQLNAAFYTEVIAPALSGRPHSAALLGTGSDVLGFDDEVSADHGWGPRLTLFVPESDVTPVRRDVVEALPEYFHGWPVRFGWDAVPVQHHVGVSTLADWLRGNLSIDPRSSIDVIDWLTIPQQTLLGMTSGPVYADHDGELRRVRALLGCFPPDVHRWLLACQWHRIAQEEAFVGRAAQVGDELGSQLVAARLAREMMRLGFLLAQVYWPYTKWFGTAFDRLPIASELAPPLRRAVAATDYPTREAALVDAYGVLARAHNIGEFTAPVDPTVRAYYGRPFLVLRADRFADACQSALTDPWLRSLPLIGSVDQFVDCTDVLSAIGHARRLRALYLT